jgi:replicative DNA helicase
MATIDDNLCIDQREFEFKFAECVIADTLYTVEQCSWLSPNDFISPALGNFWRDVLDHGDSLRAMHDLPPDVMIEITRYVTDEGARLTRPDEYARKISELAYLRSTMGEVQKIVTAISTHDASQVSALIAKMNESSPITGGVLRTSDIVGNEFIEFLKRGVVAIPTGITAIDRRFGGVFPKELTIVASRPGVGKTALVADMARRMSKAGVRVAVFSVEMARLQFWARIACGSTDFSWEDIRLGKLDAKGERELELATQVLMENTKDMLLIEDEARSLTEMHKIVTRFKPQVVIIDHLGEITWPYRDEPQIWYGLAAKYIRDHFAKKIDASAILVAQLSRAVRDRSDKRPVLTDLKWSGTLEEVADVVWMPYRDDIYNESSISSSVKRVPVEIWVRKNRYGSLGHATVMYDLRKQRFYTMTDQRLIGSMEEPKDVPF